MRTIRKNFWKPFLFGCVGLFVATIVFASEPYHEPGPPGVPLVVDWDESNCWIKFFSPVDDGGSPIIQYIVEVREEGSNRWERKGYYDGYGDAEVIRCTVEKLTEGATYYFHAIAENKAGEGKPSGESMPHTMKKK